MKKVKKYVQMKRKELDYLMVSCSSLPLPRPRSYQIAKLLAHIKGDYILITADHSNPEDIDTSLDCFYSTPSEQKIIVNERAGSFLKKILFRFFPILGQLPDKHIFWFLSVVNAVKKIKLQIKPKVIVAFSTPRTDLLIGVKLKNIFKVPLVVHFSDPWVDNPYVTYTGFKKWVNSYLESLVMKNSDLILFTNEDQRALVMRKYPSHIQDKSRVIAHCYDERLYSAPQKDSGKFIIRHVGNLYGQRSPVPFLLALSSLVNDRPDIKNRLLVEFYGQISPQHQGAIASCSLEGIVEIMPSVPYYQSLQLMAGSDLLLLIDAASAHNTFFPSKLVDYMGARKNIIGITSLSGPSAEIIAAYGGKTFQHDQIDELRDFLSHILQQDTSFTPNDNELKKYKASTVAAEFETMINNSAR